MVKVSVITPVWGKSDLTNRFLFQNWQLYRNDLDVEFVVINNGSPDNTQAVLGQWQERMSNRLQIIVNDENRGFGPANNQGAEIAQGDSLIFLSNDVILMGDYVTQVREILRQSPPALFGSQVLDYNTGWNTFKGQIIPYVVGWCLFCGREVWQDLGGFDERYVPCDYEDMDLSLTAVQKGYELRQQTLPIQHIFGQTAATLGGGREAITLKNQALFVEKWGLT